jgi:formamidopyrimidine-DNA glycosylase
MPECIEVAWTADCLKYLIVGKSIDNKKVEDVFSHGKQLFIQLEHGFYINIHFGLTGYLSVIPNEKYLRETFRFNNTTIYYYDKLHFGNVKILNQNEFEEKIGKLGIDVMDPSQFTCANLKKLIKGKKMTIAKFLMEQKYLSGIGNYLKSEILYHVRLSPYTKAGDLSETDVLNMCDAIKGIVYNAYLAGFTNQGAREYNWIAGNFKMSNVPLSKVLPLKNPRPYTFEVYEREQDSYGNKVIKEEIDGRATYYVNFSKS